MAILTDSAGFHWNQNSINGSVTTAQKSVFESFFDISIAISSAPGIPGSYESAQTPVFTESAETGRLFTRMGDGLSVERDLYVDNSSSDTLDEPNGAIRVVDRYSNTSTQTISFEITLFSALRAGVARHALNDLTGGEDPAGYDRGDHALILDDSASGNDGETAAAMIYSTALAGIPMDAGSAALGADGVTQTWRVTLEAGESVAIASLAALRDAAFDGAGASSFAALLPHDPSSGVFPDPFSVVNDGSAWAHEMDFETLEALWGSSVWWPQSHPDDGAGGTELTAGDTAARGTDAADAWDARTEALPISYDAAGGDDVIQGTNADDGLGDLILGGAGADEILGHDGHDLLFGDGPDVGAPALTVSVAQTMLNGRSYYAYAVNAPGSDLYDGAADGTATTFLTSQKFHFADEEARDDYGAGAPFHIVYALDLTGSMQQVIPAGSLTLDVGDVNGDGVYNTRLDLWLNRLLNYNAEAAWRGLGAAQVSLATFNKDGAKIAWRGGIFDDLDNDGKADFEQFLRSLRADAVEDDDEPGEVGYTALNAELNTLLAAELRDVNGYLRKVNLVGDAAVGHFDLSGLNALVRAAAYADAGEIGTHADTVDMADDGLVNGSTATSNDHSALVQYLADDGGVAVPVSGSGSWLFWRQSGGFAASTQNIIQNTDFGVRYMAAMPDPADVASVTFSISLAEGGASAGLTVDAPIVTPNFDDVLEGGGGDDHIDGGRGVDVARYAAPASEFDWSYDAASGAFIVSHLAGYGALGTDTLVGVEILEFQGGVRFDLRDSHPEAFAGVAPRIEGYETVGALIAVNAAGDNERLPLRIVDPDSELLRLTLMPDSGGFTFSEGAAITSWTARHPGVTLEVGTTVYEGAETPVWILTGSAENLTAALSSYAYRARDFVSANPTAHFPGVAALIVTVEELEEDGAGGVTTGASATRTLHFNLLDDTTRGWDDWTIDQGAAWDAGSPFQVTAGQSFTLDALGLGISNADSGRFWMNLTTTAGDFEIIDVSASDYHRGSVMEIDGGIGVSATYVFIDEDFNHRQLNVGTTPGLHELTVEITDGQKTETTTIYLEVLPSTPVADTRLLPLVNNYSVTYTASRLNAHEDEGSPLFVSAVGGDAGAVGEWVDLPSGGRVRLTREGILSADPDGDFDNQPFYDVVWDDLRYTIENAYGQTDEALLYLIRPAAGFAEHYGYAPYIGADRYAVWADGSLSRSAAEGLLANDLASANGEVAGLEVRRIENDEYAVGYWRDLAGGGSVKVETDGGFLFSTDGDFGALREGETQTVSFFYSAANNRQYTGSRIVEITVNGVEDAPVAADDFFDRLQTDRTLTLSAADLLGNDTDADGDALSLVDGTYLTPWGATVTISGDVVLYDPTASSAVTDLRRMDWTLDSFSYQVVDGTGLSDVGTAYIELGGINHAPVAQADFVETDEDTPILIDALANDWDFDEDLPSYAYVDVISAAGVWVDVRPDGIYYDPTGHAAFNALGSGDTVPDVISYQIADGYGGYDWGEIEITVHGRNDAPTAILPDGITIPDGTAAGTLLATLSAEDVDFDDTHSFTLLSDHGAWVSISGDQLLLNLDADLLPEEIDPLVLMVEDQDGARRYEAITVERGITPVASAGPEAGEDSADARAGIEMRVAIDDLLLNDAAADGGPVIFAGLGEALNGDARIEGDEIVFLADREFRGITTVDYIVSDADGRTATGELRIDVSPRPIGEVQRIDIGTDWTTLEFNGRYDNPMVFALSPTMSESDAVVTRLRNIDGVSAEIKLQETVLELGALNPGDHVDEEVVVVVLEKGMHVLEDGTMLEVGEKVTNKVFRQGFDQVYFDSAFDETPAIFAQVQTNYGTNFVLSRQAEANADGFLMNLQEEEADNLAHLWEEVGWFAIERGAGASDGIDWEVGLTDKLVNQNVHYTPFTADLGDDPLVMAGMPSYSGTDPASPRMAWTASHGFGAQVIEDRSANEEIQHGLENLAWIAFSEEGYIV